MNEASNSARASAPPPDGLSLRAANAARGLSKRPPLYNESDLSAPGMAEARRALTHVLSRGEPYPVFVTDRLWDVVAANDAGRRLLGLMLGEARMARPVNFMRLFLGPDELKRHIVNWPAVALAMIHRAGRDLAAAPDAADLRDLWQALAADPDVAALAGQGGDLPPGALGEVRFAAQGREIGLIGLTSSFAAPQDVTLDELRIESFLPADDSSDDILFRMAAPA